MSLSKLALACVMLMAGQTPSSGVVYTNLRSGEIPAELQPTRADEVREMVLYISPDLGKT